ncbi:MAG: hypothetical protein C0617_07185 [Desulfuromonas sp.]|uniref:SPOR domain-containing protein n=1 Tax=Desulfuromonas sp. TaxID=892 RepID=UPI000CAE5745|nr:SPOR domain-containing protein [Desulfuromonas sp.]PLX84615.1 MAG: hypothetical protein C0617_07185 [Desulfuromonas sp.]
MAAEEEFNFDEELEELEEVTGPEYESVRTPEDGLQAPEESPGPEGAPLRKKSPLPRILGAVLLLVVAASAGLYLYSGRQDAPGQSVRPELPQRQPIAIPASPTGEPGREKLSDPANRPALERGVIVEVHKSEPAPVQAYKPKPAPVQASKPKPAPVQASKPEPVAGPAPPAQKPVGRSEAASARTGAFTLQAGAFLVEANSAEVARKVRELGFEPRSRKKDKTVEMTRLRIGILPAAEAKNRLDELAESVPQAFHLPRGGDWAVYAASFHDLRGAREYAEELARKGIAVEEERTRVELPLIVLSFGAFPDRAAAEKAASLAREAGLEVDVVPGGALENGDTALVNRHAQSD